MFNLEKFLKITYARLFGDSEEIEDEAILLSKYMTDNGYCLPAEAVKTLESLKSKREEEVTVKITKDGNYVARLCIGKELVIFEGERTLINFSTGEMRVPTNSGYVIYPYYESDEAYYFSAGSVEYMKAVLENKDRLLPFHSREIEIADITRLFSYIDPDDIHKVDEDLGFEEVILDVLDYADKTKAKEKIESEKCMQ